MACKTKSSILASQHDSDYDSNFTSKQGKGANSLQMCVTNK